MPLSEFERKRCEKLVAQFIEKRRPQPHVRGEVDLSFHIQGQSVEIFEMRPHWHNTTQILERPIAKATYNSSRRNWEVFCQGRDLKWHRYEPCPQVQSIDDFLALVEQDEYACFFG